MPGKKKETRQSGSRKRTSNDNYTNLSSLTDSSQIVASLFGNNSTLNVSGRKSEGKRKSLPYVIDSQDANGEEDYETEATDVEEIKEIEKALAVKATLEQTKKAEKFENKTKATNLIQKLSHEELELHYSKCIDMSSKNKINIKNAFKLQLIDFMKLMMDRKTEKSENLTLMSCTLDASAKIYSCRVDNVYSNILKIVKTYLNDNKTKNDDKKRDIDSPLKGSGDEASGDEGSLSKKKDKKKHKTLKTERLQFIKDTESLNRKEVKMCYYRQNLPRNQTYFIESPILDEGHMLAPNRPLFVKNSNGPPKTSTYTIDSAWEGEVGNDNLEEKIPGYRDIRSKIFIADDGPENESMTNQDNAFTYDPSIESIAEIKNFNDVTDGQSECGNDDKGAEVEIDYDDYDMDPPRDDIEENVELSVSRTSEQPTNVNDQISLPDVNGSKPRVSFTPIAMSRMLRSSSSKASDYSLFDDSKIAFMPSATHWKIKPSKRINENVGKTSSHTVRRGKTQYLDFSEDQIKPSLDGTLKDRSVPCKLSVKTTKDWFHKKNEFIYKPIIPNIRKNLLSIFKDQGICISSLKVPLSGDERENAIDESVLLNPLDYTAADAEDDFDDDNNGGDYHPLEDWSEKMDPDPVPDTARLSIEEPSTTDDQVNPQVSELTEEVDNNMTIVPLPPRVEKVSVKYAKMQKRIDIKKLKGNIWNLMDLENKGSENKENEKRNKSNNGDSEEKCVHFSDVYKGIPHIISKEAAAELSFPIAFMAILHMANEKNLRLAGDQEHKDFTVSLDFPPK